MPDAFLTRRQLLMTAIESVYATDAAPQHSNSYQAIRLVDEFTLDLGQEVVEQTAGNLSRGMSRPIGTVRPAGITFRTYFQGLDAASYTGNQKPPHGDLLRACGLFETFTSSNANGRPEYRYDPGADVGSDTSVTIVAHQDGFEHRLLGCRGNANIIHLAAAPTVFEFNLRGILSTEASTTRGSPTGLPTVTPPRWIGSGSIFVQSHAADVENCNFNTNNNVFEDRVSNALSGSGIIRVLITERAPGGSFDPEGTEPNTFSYFGAWRSSSGFVLRLQTGIDQGNRMTIIASQAVLKTVGWGDKSGMSIFSSDYQCYERGADSEYRLVFD